MKIFFSASPRGNKQFINQYRAIYDTIRTLEYVHVDDDVINVSEDIFNARMKQEGKKAYVALYNKKTEAIAKADMCIFESSLHSAGVGLLIQKALDLCKPTIVLYYKDNIPYFISGMEDEKLIVHGYNETNVELVVRNMLNRARERRDKRFNFFLTPKLLDYLDETSKKQGSTKSKLIRDLIVDHMRNNIMMLS